ncbi:hypothetical protein MASR1M101_05400 [Gemmatimonas sp.]
MSLGVSGGSGQGTGYWRAGALLRLWRSDRHSWRYAAGVGDTNQCLGGSSGIPRGRVAGDTYGDRRGGSGNGATGREADAGNVAPLAYARRAAGAGGGSGAARGDAGRGTRHVSNRSRAGAHTGGLVCHANTRCGRFHGTDPGCQRRGECCHRSRFGDSGAFECDSGLNDGPHAIGGAAAHQSVLARRPVSTCPAVGSSARIRSGRVSSAKA